MRRSLLAVLAVVATALWFAVPAYAITHGQPDGARHPYVGLEDNGVFACTGTLISRTVVVTAAHCFSDSQSVYGTDAAGNPIVRVTFDPRGFTVPAAQRQSFFGSYFFDPQFCIGCAHGLPGFDTHDVAVIILGTPVPSSVTSTYGALPTPGLVDTLANGTAVTSVGYGAQNFAVGGGPCGGPCKPRVNDIFTRFFAPSQLIASNDRISAEFLKLSANPGQGQGGTCFGDSGGPNLLDNTNTILSVNSFVTNGRCNGVTYSFRLDTPEALSFIQATIAAHT
jgi:trypsin